MGKTKLLPSLKLFAALCCCAYVAYAVYFNVLGANAAALIAYFGVSEPQLGLVTTFQAVGILLVTGFAALWGDRFNKVHLVAVGLGIMGAAALMIGLLPYLAPGAGFYAMLLLSLAAGVGFTFIDIMVNSSIADVFGEMRNTVLPVAHTSFGAGSMLAPLLVTAAVNPASPQTFSAPYLMVGIAAAAVLAAFLLGGRRITKDTPYARKRAHNGSVWEIFTQKESWILLAASVTYFAFQIGMSTWLPSYCELERGMAFDWSGRMVTVFFAGALVMRFASMLLLKKWKAKQLYVALGLAAAACAVISLAVPGDAAFAALIAVCGFLQGAQSILLVLMCCAAFPARTASAASLITMAIGVAMLVFPYVMALLAQQWGFGNAVLMICGSLAASSAIVFGLGRKRELA